MEKLTILGKTYEVSKQAKVAFYAYLTAVVAFIATALVSKGRPILYMAFTGMMLVLMTIIGTYVVNCLVVGQCNLYAWFMTVMSVIIASMYVIGFIVMAAMRLRNRK